MEFDAENCRSGNGGVGRIGAFQTGPKENQVNQHEDDNDDDVISQIGLTTVSVVIIMIVVQTCLTLNKLEIIS